MAMRPTKSSLDLHSDANVEVFSELATDLERKARLWSCTVTDNVLGEPERKLLGVLADTDGELGGLDVLSGLHNLAAGSLQRIKRARR